MKDSFTNKVIVDAEFFKLSGEPLSYLDALCEEKVKVLGKLFAIKGKICDLWHEENFYDLNLDVNVVGKIYENYVLINSGEKLEFVPSYLTLKVESQKVILGKYSICYLNEDYSQVVRYPISQFFEHWENICNYNNVSGAGKMSVKVYICDNNKEYYTNFIKYVWIANNTCFIVTEENSIYEVIKCDLPRQTKKKKFNLKFDIIQNARFYDISSKEEISFDNISEDESIYVLGINYKNNKNIAIKASKYDNFFITENGIKYIIIPDREKNKNYVLKINIYWYEMFENYHYIRILPSDILKVKRLINDGIEVKAVFGICEKEAYISGEIESGQTFTSRINEIILKDAQVVIKTNNCIYVTEDFIN